MAGSKSSPIRRVMGRRNWTILWVGLIALVLAGSFWRPGYAGYLRYRGSSALDARKIPEALVWLTRSQDVQPTSELTQFALARAYRLSGQLSEMRSHLQRAWDLGFPVERLKREQLLAIAQVGRIREVEPQLAELFSDPGEDGREICEAVVSGMFLSYRLQEAFRILDAWRRDFPSDPQPDVVQGMYFFQSGAWLKAVESFQRALQIAPARSDARFHLAEAFRHLHRLEESQRNYRVCIDEAPGDPSALIGLGRCLFEQGELKQSRSLLTQALAIDPKHPIGLYLLGKLKVADGNAQEALALVEQAFALRPFDPEVRYLLAQTLQATGHAERAREHFDYIFGQQQAQSRLRNMLEELEDEPARVDLRYRIGVTLLEYGNPEEGAGWLRSVLEYAPNHPEACHALAKYLRRLGRDAQASELDQRAATQNTTIPDTSLLKPPTHQ